MKMTKQVKKMVMAVNDILKSNHIKNEDNELFSITCWLLIQAGCYDGFNYFTADDRLSGGNNEKCDHLKIYIK